MGHEVYEITSKSGRIYSRKMLIDRAARMWRGLISIGLVSRSELAAVVDDNEFMRWRRGYTPTALANDVGLEAIARRANGG